MSRKYWCFLNSYDFQLPKQTSQQQWYLQCFDKTTCKKHNALKQFFKFFQLVLNHFLRHFCHRSFGLKKVSYKSQKHAKLHLKSTFCVSQSLPQFSNSKNWGKITLFYEHTMHFTCKNVPFRAKTDLLLVPPERHAPLHLRCGRI